MRLKQGALKSGLLEGRSVAVRTGDRERASGWRKIPVCLGVLALAVGPIEVNGASFGPLPPIGSGLTGDIACMKDGTADGSDFNGCTTANNPGDVTGKIALIDRGGCAFATKVANAQAAGAVGAVIANVSGGPFTMGGTDPTILIPSVMVGRTDREDFRNETCSCPLTLNLTGTLSGDQTSRAETVAILGSNLDIDGTTAVRVVANRIGVRNDVSLGGTVILGTAADGCTAP